MYNVHVHITQIITYNETVDDHFIMYTCTCTCKILTLMSTKLVILIPKYPKQAGISTNSNDSNLNGKN